MYFTSSVSGLTVLDWSPWSDANTQTCPAPFLDFVPFLKWGFMLRLCLTLFFHLSSSARKYGKFSLITTKYFCHIFNFVMKPTLSTGKSPTRSVQFYPLELLWSNLCRCSWVLPYWHDWHLTFEEHWMEEHDHGLEHQGLEIRDVPESRVGHRMFQN